MSGLHSLVGNEPFYALLSGPPDLCNRSSGRLEPAVGDLVEGQMPV